ncbi:MAG TPA: spore coat U domain-containing protein [Nitrospiria bacterium]|nr:spore coat U domain-containing protein [Nitrospiria bacterium]
MRGFNKFILISFFLLLSGEAYAACTVATTGVNFGNYDVFVLTPLNSTGSITVTCDVNPPTDVTISIGPSQNSGVMNPRQMKRTTGPDLLNYNFFTDAGRTSVWGDGSGGTTTVFLKNVPRNRPRSATVYGSIPPNQNVFAGSYSDLLTVTITP